MKKLYSTIVWFEKGILIVALILMVIVTFAQVVARFVLHHPLSWSAEMARYLFVWITLMGASLAITKGSHFGIDVFANCLPVKLRKAVSVLTYVVILSFAVIMIIYGIQVVKFTWIQFSPALHIRMSFPYLAIPVAGVFMIIHVIEAFTRYLKGEGEIFSD